MDDMIMNYDVSSLHAPDGSIIWQGNYDDRLDAFTQHVSVGGDSFNVLASLCGSPVRKDGTDWVNPTEARDTAENLGFITRRGNVPGFFTLLPAGTYLDHVAQSFNRKYFQALNAHEIEFPVIFDNRPPDIKELTAGYESQGRMFRLDERDDGYRFTYAADPNLFSWLRDKTLLSERLPYTIVSPTIALRRHPSGQLGPYGKSRQFKFPDLHVISSPEEAHDSLLNLVKLNGASVKFWVGDNYAQFLDATPDFLEKNPNLPAQMAKQANTYTIVNRLTQQPRYYSMRTGMMVDAGTDALMFHNIQWDQVNAQRFNIRMEDRAHPVIIHASALASSKLISILIGRALAGAVPKTLPPEYVAHPITLVPLREEFQEAALQHVKRLTTKGIDARIETVKKSLGTTVWALRSLWQPAFAVIGGREATSEKLVFSQGHSASTVDEDTFYALHLDRVQRCRGAYASPDNALPFFVDPPPRSGKDIAPKQKRELVP